MISCNLDGRGGYPNTDCSPDIRPMPAARAMSHQSRRFTESLSPCFIFATMMARTMTEATAITVVSIEPMED